MEYLITKIKVFIMLHNRKIDMLILFLFYLWFLDLETITSCSPTPVDPGLPGCLEAQRLAIKDLQENSASKSWLTVKVQTVGANGMQGEKGTATIIKDNHPYTVQVAQVKDEKGTFRLLSDCMRGGSIKKDS
jgi:hypothetical protein